MTIKMAIAFVKSSGFKKLLIYMVFAVVMYRCESSADTTCSVSDSFWSYKSSYDVCGMQRDGFCFQWMSTGAIDPRSIAVTEKGNVLLLDRGNSHSEGLIKYIADINGDGVSEASFVIARMKYLSHGLEVFSLPKDNGNVYASTPAKIYRWRYTEGQKEESKDSEIVVYNINSGGEDGSDLGAPRGHTTRTLAFDKSSGYLYISVGSGSNVDTTLKRSMIRRVFMHSPIPREGHDFQSLEVFAQGLRNEVGLAFDSLNVLWGVENSGDNLVRRDLGGDIHKNNPAEELNRFKFKTANSLNHYGYPFCFTEYNIPQYGEGKGTVWAWPDYVGDGIHSDDWCRSNTIAPVVCLQAHSAPLGVVFFDASKPLDPSCRKEEAFPDQYDGYAFISYHGSWNRNPATGYKVVGIPFNKTSGMPLEGLPTFDFIACETRNRPVDVKFDKCNRLLVSVGSDHTGTNSGVIMVKRSNVMKMSDVNSEDLIARSWRKRWSYYIRFVSYYILIIGVPFIIFSRIIYIYICRCRKQSDEATFDEREVEMMLPDNQRGFQSADSSQAASLKV